MTRDRLAPVLAALATLLTAWSLSPVVEDSQWQAPCILMVLGVLLVGLGARALRLPRALVLLTQVVVCGLLVTALFAGESAVGGLLPGRAAVRDLGRLLDMGGSVIGRYATPVPGTRGITLILVLGVLGIAVLVDLLVSTLRAPAAAGIPLLALYAVPAAVVPAGLPARYFAAAALGWLLLLAHDASSKVTRWGRLLPRWGEQPTASRATISNDTSALAATGRRLGVISIVLAVGLPAVVPGLPDGLLTGGSSSAAEVVVGRTSINPVLSLRESLTNRQNVEVLRYTTAQRDLQPLRILTADRFDGETWQPTTREVSRRNRASRGLPPPPGLSAAVPVETFTMHVTVGPVLDQDFLPLPYPTRKVNIAGTWLFDPSSLNVIGDRESARGQEYDATYLAVRPTPAQLRGSSTPLTPELRAFTALPKGLPPSVAATARRVVQGQDTAYDRALALQQWFRSDGKFTYSTTVPNDASSDAVASFLVKRQGYCVQFASAMAVMARTLGIPARIGVGFLPGQRDGDKGQVVKLTDAHAWPELYFGGVGWVRFEPTPAVRAGSAPAWARQEATTGGPGSGADSGGPQGQATGAKDPRVRNLENSEDGQSSSGLTDPIAPAPANTAPHRGWVLAVCGLLLLAGLTAATPMTAALARRRRRHMAVDASSRADACWIELHDSVADLGVRLSAAWTPRRVQEQLALAIPLTQVQSAALHRLVAAVERSQYARPVSVVNDVEHPSAAGSSTVDSDVPADLRTVVRAVASSRPRMARLQAQVLPASGRARIAGGLRQLQQRVDSADQWAAQKSHRLSPRRLRFRRAG